MMLPGRTACLERSHLALVTNITANAAKPSIRNSLTIDPPTVQAGSSHHQRVNCTLEDPPGGGIVDPFGALCAADVGGHHCAFDGLG